MAATFADACAERAPLEVETEESTPALAGAPTVLRLSCRVRVVSRTLSCDPPPAAGRGDLLVGGQDRFVKIRSSNLALTPLPPAALRSSGGRRGDVLPPPYATQLSADVTVQNLLGTPMGTSDGSTPDPFGLRIFFFSAPTVVAGSGQVGVLNPDGTATFTAAGQQFFSYPGILGPGEVSAARNWHFGMSEGVTEFAFQLMVSAPVPGESGWITVSPVEPQLNLGQAVRLTGTVHTATGFVIGNQTVTWSSADSLVAKVDALGIVSGRAPGETTITASSGGRSGSTRVTVGTFDATAPTFTAFALSRDSVHDGDSLKVTVALSDGGVGVDSFRVRVASPDNLSRASCSAFVPLTGTRGSGTWECSLRIPPGASPGKWAVEIATAADWRGNLRALSRFDPPISSDPFVQVATAAVDLTPPFLDGFSYSAPTVNAGQNLQVTATLFDLGTRPAGWSASWFRDGGGNESLECRAANLLFPVPTSLQLPCTLEVPEGTLPGNWSLRELVLTDGGGNRRLLTAADLEALHFPPGFSVADPHPDPTPPVLRSFSVGDATGAAKDTVKITATMFDPGGSGIAELRMYARGRNVPRGMVCGAILNSPTQPLDAVEIRLGECTLVAPPPPEAGATGEYFIELLELRDRAGNKASYNTSDLQSRHLPYVMRFGP